jgi:hypothetical protein
MTQEEELRWIDLSGRLPYHPICGTKSSDYKPTCRAGISGNTRRYFFKDDLKVFLRPMSSMTEEESKEFALLQTDFYVDGVLYPIAAINMINWLNSHHFDYRGLIPMGLALEAKEGMYKT